MLDGKEPIAFDHDCREGICGSCGMMINGQAHGPERGTATCQLHMRKFSDGDHVTIEPWRAASRSSRTSSSTAARSTASSRPGGYISVGTGGAPDGNLIPIPKPVADAAMDAAACIGCGACVAACPNGAAQLFTSAKMQHLNLMPQGQAERWDRTIEMVETMETYFGSCTNHRECEAACPKSISIDFIALMNRDYAKAQLKQRRLVGQIRSTPKPTQIFAPPPTGPSPSLGEEEPQTSPSAEGRRRGSRFGEGHRRTSCRTGRVVAELPRPHRRPRDGELRRPPRRADDAAHREPFADVGRARPSPAGHRLRARAGVVARRTRTASRSSCSKAIPFAHGRLVRIRGTPRHPHHAARVGAARSRADHPALRV